MLNRLRGRRARQRDAVGESEFRALEERFMSGEDAAMPQATATATATVQSPPEEADPEGTQFDLVFGIGLGLMNNGYFSQYSYSVLVFAG